MHFMGISFKNINAVWQLLMNKKLTQYKATSCINAFFYLWIMSFLNRKSCRCAKVIYWEDAASAIRAPWVEKKNKYGRSAKASSTKIISPKFSKKVKKKYINMYNTNYWFRKVFVVLRSTNSESFVWVSL